ncbi:protein suppressor of quenting 1, chloroplastic isoform X2 [Tanacetum coccineum]
MDYAKPDSGIGFPGALELITECKNSGLKVAVASSADRIKVDANLAAAGLPSSKAFCIVIEDALAGVQAAQAAKMRCIAVTTTLSEDTLKEAKALLIRKEIGYITLQDILGGGSSYSTIIAVGSQSMNNLGETSSTLKKDMEGGSFQDAYATNDMNFSIGGLQGSRRQIVRYGSLGIALSCLYFTVSNMKAMQYASPKAIWNLLLGGKSPPFGKSEDGTRSSRIQQFTNYISDVESKGNTSQVPEFPSKLDWLNTVPLQLRRDLKGKVVLLDFWTYCCINCMHVLPDLEFLEKKYKDMPFTVVGVHSAKFDNEKDLEAIRNAVLRYGITHPVVNDGDMYMWRELGINSWPTFAIISPTGKLIAQLAGEGRRKDLDDFVEAALLFYGRRKLLDSTPVPLRLEKDNDPRLSKSPLKFPGKLAVDVFNKRLFISDSNHNRIVVTDLDGNFLLQVGSTGEEGLRDGNFDNAMFNRPQASSRRTFQFIIFSKLSGLAYNATKNVLYVADTENHALRVIDFVNESVQTLAGNGTKGSDYKGGGKGTSQARYNIISFLIISAHLHIYYVVKVDCIHCNGRTASIWVHSTHRWTFTRAFSGDGFEETFWSSSLTTSFAQPSGLSLSPDVKEAYIADSESSSIRALNLKTGGSRLLAGGDPVFSDNLFKYLSPSLQALTILIIDYYSLEIMTELVLKYFFNIRWASYVEKMVDFCGRPLYNHKIKKLDPTTKKVSTLAGTGKAGFKDGVASLAQLSEPAGIVEDDAAVVDPLDGSLSPDGTAVLHFKRSSPSATVGRVNCKANTSVGSITNGFVLCWYTTVKRTRFVYTNLLYLMLPFKEVSPENTPQEIKLPFIVKPKSSEGTLQLPIAAK